MSFDVSKFRGKLTYDGARPNLFKVAIADITDIWEGSDGLEFFCKASQIPGVTIGTVPVNYFGRQVKLAGNKTFADWTVTVINDENFAHRSQFEAWMDALSSAQTNLRSGTSATDYTQTAKVTQLSKTQAKSREYAMHYAWPTDISPITLDWGDNDTIEEYTVTFSFDYWTTVTGETKETATNTTSKDVSIDGVQ